jgi:hypothetical protein
MGAVHSKEDEPAVALGAHPRQDRERGLDRAQVVARQHSVRVRFRAVLEEPHDDRPDGMHEDVDPAAARFGGSANGARGLARPPVVGRHRNRLGATGRSECRQRLLGPRPARAVSEGDPIAVAGENDGDAARETARGARDQGTVALGHRANSSGAEASSGRSRASADRWT